MSWLTALTVAGAGYYYYSNQGQPTSNRTRGASVSNQVQPQQTKAPRRREEAKSRRKNEVDSKSEVSSSDVPAASSTSVASRAEPSKKRKGGKSAGPVAAAPPVIVNNDDADTEEADNRAWAQQLAQARQGTSLAPPAQAGSRSKTVKQSAARGAAPAFSSASSTGAEADDDLSPAMSPSLRAGDVSDMLEAPAAGPSSLRLTAPVNPPKQRQPKKENAFQEAETKKQRQNRQKKEAARLEREAEEKERQVLLEKQRRAAREARGEPARNGMVSSQPPATSAWAAETVSRVMDEPTAAVSANNAPLLDTFDHDGESTASSNGPLANSTAATSTAAKYDNGLPSEEDQMRVATKLSEDESGWNTVPKGRKQKKNRQAADTTDGSDTGSVHNIAVEQPTPAVSKAPAPVSKPSNGFAHLNGFSGIDAGSHPEDSEWGA